jgi:hypothetical protein
MQLSKDLAAILSGHRSGFHSKRGENRGGFEIRSIDISLPIRKA